MRKPSFVAWALAVLVEIKKRSIEQKYVRRRGPPPATARSELKRSLRGEETAKRGEKGREGARNANLMKLGKMTGNAFEVKSRGEGE